MLDKKSKCILKVINKIKDSYGEVNDSESLYPHLPKKYTKMVVENVLKHLKDLGLISYQILDARPQDISLTYKGENYKEFQWIKFKSFILESICTPIIVAILTTLVTLWLKSVI